MLTSESPTQRALANRLSARCELVGIVLSKNIPRKQTVTIGQRIQWRVGASTLARPLVAAISEMTGDYQRRYADYPGRVHVRVDNVNDDATLDLLQEKRPDLIVVSGTNMVGNRVIDAAHHSGRLVNLHTGISPYVKGGPNCTNWCLAKGWFDRIGNTVMWLDRGVDTGNVIATERTPLTGDESLAGLHIAVMNHAHDLYARAISALAGGQQMPSVSQHEIGAGVTFKNSQWNALEARRAVRNFQRGYRAAFACARDTDDIRLIPLSDGANAGGAPEL